MRIDIPINPEYTSAIVNLEPILNKVRNIVEVIHKKIDSIDFYFESLDVAAEHSYLELKKLWRYKIFDISEAKLHQHMIDNGFKFNEEYCTVTKYYRDSWLEIQAGIDAERQSSYLFWYQQQDYFKSLLASLEGYATLGVKKISLSSKDMEQINLWADY